VGVFAGRFGGLSANVLVLTVMIGIYGLSWRTALYILATVGMLHGIMFLVAFRDSPREHPQANEAEAELVEGEEGPAANEPLKFRELIRQMDGRSILNLACINVSSIFSSIADQIYSLWIPLFLFEQYSLKFKEMGIYSALPLLGGACGGMLGGFISDRLIRLTGSRRWVRSLVGCFGKAMAALMLAIAVLFFFDDPYLFCGMLFVVKLFADISLTSRWGTVTDVGGKATATVFAFNNSVASFVAMFFPAIYGWVSDNYDWQTVFWMACASYVGCAVAWLSVDCTVTLLVSDRERSVEE
jgi:sugar phosphate permease